MSCSSFRIKICITEVLRLKSWGSLRAADNTRSTRCAVALSVVEEGSGYQYGEGLDEDV